MSAPCVAVAYSGGRDSTALLHAVASAARDGMASPDGGGCTVLALHVHHGLSVHADDWLGHAEVTCDAWRAAGLPVSLRWRRVQVAQGPGLSLEAEARRARHAALQEMAHEAGADLLLLAHHRRDQAETLLLQALRGGSVAGLAGIPRDVVRAGVRWVRPWLDHPREAIEAYVAAHGLSHIEDDSNADPRWARNRLRMAVWPVLTEAFPQAESALAASAQRVADTLGPLAQWRAAQLPTVQALDGGLDVLAWSRHEPGERRELLRHWYAQASGAALSAAWLMRLSEELPRVQQASGVGRWPDLGLRVYRGRLQWSAHEPNGPLAQRGAWPADPVAEVDLAVQGEGDWPVPGWPGFLRVERVASGGVAAYTLHALRARARVGGEQFQLGLGRPPRALKKQYQAMGVPPWARQAPLFWAGELLAFVPGLGVDARVRAEDGAPQWGLRWLPAHAESGGV